MSKRYSRPIHVAEQLAGDPSNVVDRIMQQWDSDYEWIKKNIEERRCNRFVQSSPNQPELCQCGYKKEEHDETSEGPAPSQWTVKDCTVTKPTSAYADIEFDGCRDDHLAKYVRVDVNTDMEKILEMMTEAWNLGQPRLLISVTGGAKDFKLSPQHQEAFRRGLKQAAGIAGAWIITGGTHTGVMKHVGKAVKDLRISGAGLTAIGVAPWGCVKNKEMLLRKQMPKESSLARYRMEGEERQCEAFLNPNHTHFILVDNGTQHKFGTEIEFRSKLERAISDQKIAAGKTNVPVVLLVLEGGPNTLRTVKEAVQRGTPTVIIKGSGRFADVLAEAVQLLELGDTQEQEGQKGAKLRGVVERVQRQTEVQNKVGEIIASKGLHKDSDDELKKLTDEVMECLKRSNLLSVYELDTTAKSASDVDLAFLSALLKAKTKENEDANRKRQLELALSWNKVDVAKSQIFTDGSRWTTEELTGFMMQALKEDKVGFVELFMDNGLSLREFLTVARLKELYTVDRPKESSTIKKIPGVPDTHPVHSLLKQPDPHFPLRHVGRLLQKLMGDYYKPRHYLNEKQPDLDPNQELFVWAVLLNRLDMAKLFWEKTPEPTAAALVAAQLLKRLAQSQHTKDAHLQRAFEESSAEFETHAAELLRACFLKDGEQTQRMLVRELPEWGQSSCVQIAFKSDSKRFISETACQRLLDTVWKGDMTESNSYWKILLCTVLFPLICTPLIKFKSEHPLQPAEGQNTKACLGRIERFYRSPVVTFCLTCVSYLLFLTLYAYTLLVQLAPTFHITEAVVLVWFVCIFLVELMQTVSRRKYSENFKMRMAFVVLTAVFFLCGGLLRALVTPCPNCYHWGRVLLALCLLLLFVRVLGVFSISRELGPKVVMIRRMMRDLKWFLVILLVFVVSYAIASEAILYPNTALSWKLLYYLPRKAYWHIYGELFLDEVEVEEQAGVCTDDPALYGDYSQPRCPSPVGHWVASVLLGVYMLVTNVLLLNLLIAMFSFTFTNVQNETDLHWHYQRFSVVLEYAEAFLPFPFILFTCVFRLATRLLKRCGDSGASVSDPFKVKYGDKETWRLKRWESMMLIEMYLSRLEVLEAESTDGKVKTVATRLEAVQHKVDDVAEMLHRKNKREKRAGANMEKKVDEVKSLISEICHGMDRILQMLTGGAASSTPAGPPPASPQPGPDDTKL